MSDQPAGRDRRADPRTAGSEQRYPPYVRTPEERRRWGLAAGIAAAIFDEVGMEADRWMATRSIYNSRLPTDG